jgi:hypothetical protein
LKMNREIRNTPTAPDNAALYDIRRPCTAPNVYPGMISQVV